MKSVRSKDKDKVAELKLYYYNEPEKLVQWILENSSTHAMYHEILKVNCDKILTLLTNLEYTDVPLYGVLDDYFASIVRGSKEKVCQFDFSGGENNLLFNSNNIEDDTTCASEPNQKILKAKVKVLGQIVQDLLTNNIELSENMKEELYGDIINVLTHTHTHTHTHTKASLIFLFNIYIYIYIYVTFSRKKICFY